MKTGIHWKSIKTVLLDMDGTLLDLYFDNYFWQDYLPWHWGKLNNISAHAAKVQLKAWYEKEAGTLTWYCLDFWTERLKLDVLELKKEITHLINIRPHTKDFLTRLARLDCAVVMVTNAHEKLLEMKIKQTRIDVFFDHIISAHTIGHAKEEQAFWNKLQRKMPFSLEETVLIDDNLTVLRAARQFGIKNLLTIKKPDSRAEAQQQNEFQAIDCFKDIRF